MASWIAARVAIRRHTPERFCVMQYKKLYQEVKDENMRLRAQNGDISQALNQEMRALQRDNCKLQQLLEKSESDNMKLIDAPTDLSLIHI